MKMFEQREAVAHLLKNFAHESRLMILCLLAEKEMFGEINEEKFKPICIISTLSSS